MKVEGTSVGSVLEVSCVLWTPSVLSSVVIKSAGVCVFSVLPPVLLSDSVVLVSVVVFVTPVTKHVSDMKCNKEIEAYYIQNLHKVLVHRGFFQV